MLTKTIQEFKTSTVQPSIIESNVVDVDSSEIINRLYNLQRPANWATLAKNHFTKGGWSVNGVFPSKSGWAVQPYPKVKLTTPRSLKGKLIKYESGYGYSFHNPLPLYFPIINDKLAAWFKAEFKLDGEVDGQGNGWLYTSGLPITLVEGEKKALALLSHGKLAVSLPGIWMGARRNILEEGSEWKHSLHPQLSLLIEQSPKTEFTILFDYEKEAIKRLNLIGATTKLGYALLNQNAAAVKVALLPGNEKGVDDWLVCLTNHLDRITKLDNLLTAALSFSTFLLRSENYKEQLLLTWENLSKEGKDQYADATVINQKYLPELPTNPGTLGLRSAMGTGKSYAIAQRLAKEPELTVLVVCHRVTLCAGLAANLNKINSSARFTLYQDVQGSCHAIKRLVITFDSLVRLANEKGALPKFDVVIVDEVNQVLRHALSSSTCRLNRQKSLDIFDWVLKQCQQLIVADAHLSRESLDYIKAVRPQPIELILNKYKTEARTIYIYDKQNTLIENFTRAIVAKKKVLFVSTSKKDVKRYARAAAYQMSGDLLFQVCDEDENIRSIHGDNSGATINRAFIRDINAELKKINNKANSTFLLSYSPSLGTGVDIQEGNFDILFGTFKPCNLDHYDCLQMMWRYRAKLPMHIYISSSIIGGIRQTNPERIKENLLASKANSLSTLNYDDEGIPNQNDYRLNTYAKIIAKSRKSIYNLKANLELALEAKGCRVMPVTDQIPSDSGSLLKFKECVDQLNIEMIEGLKAAPLITDEDAKRLIKKKNKLQYLSPEESILLNKYRINKEWGEVTNTTIERHDEGRGTSSLIQLDNALRNNTQDFKERDIFEFTNNISLWDYSHSSQRHTFLKDTKIKDLLETLLNSQIVSPTVGLGKEVCEKLRALPQQSEALYHWGNTVKKSNTVLLRTVINHFGLNLESKSQRASKELLQSLGVSAVASEKVRIFSLEEEEAPFLTKTLNYRSNARKPEVEPVGQSSIEKLQARFNQPLGEVIILKPGMTGYQKHLTAMARWERISIDIETYTKRRKDKSRGKEHFANIAHKDFTRTIQLSNGQITFIVDLGGRMNRNLSANQEALNIIKERIENPDVTIIGQNFSFDLRMLAALFGGLVPRNLRDTRIGSKIFFGNYSGYPIVRHGLKPLVERFLGLTIDKTEQSSDWGFLLTDSQIAYAADDAHYTYWLCEALEHLYDHPEQWGYAELAQDGVKDLWLMESEMLKVCLEMERNGMPINQQKLRDYRAALEGKLKQLSTDWIAICPDYKYTQTDKVKSFLASHYGIQVSGLGKEQLYPYTNNPLVKLRSELNSLAKHIKLVDNYLQGIEEFGQERAFTYYDSPTGTGRLSSGCKDDKAVTNLQNVPAPNKTPLILQSLGVGAFRECFEPQKGWKLIVSDLPAAHARFAAALSNCTSAIAAFADDSVDNHSKVAVFVARGAGYNLTDKEIQAILKDKRHKLYQECKLWRGIAKNTFYGYLNGAGAARLAEQISAQIGKTVDIELAKAAIAGCDEIYPEIGQYQKGKTNQVNHDTVIIDGVTYCINRMEAVGARILFPRVPSRFAQNPDGTPSLEAPYTQVLAATWSRPEAYVVKVSCLDISEAIAQQYPGKARLVGQIHDEIVLEVREDIALEVAALANTILYDHFDRILGNCPGGRETDVSRLVCNNWSEK